MTLASLRATGRLLRRLGLEESTGPRVVLIVLGILNALVLASLLVSIVGAAVFVRAYLS
jgi:hypothetical protein